MHPIPTLQGTMTAKNHDCKAQWWQSTMTVKNNDGKEEWPQGKMIARKQWLQRTVPCKEQFWKEVLHESFVFTCFHIFNLQILKEVSTKASIAQLQLADVEGTSHESFVFISSTRRFWRRRARKLSFAQLQLAGFEKEVSHENFVFISLQLDHGESMCRTTDLSLASQ